MNQVSNAYRKTQAIALSIAWGAEWNNLSANAQALVLADTIEAIYADGSSVMQLKGFIGKGNLKNYADCLIAQANRKTAKA